MINVPSDFFNEKHENMKNRLSFFLFLAFGVPLLSQQTSEPNVLFIAVDDLKPIMGTVFGNNYCQQAIKLVLNQIL